MSPHLNAPEADSDLVYPRIISIPSFDEHLADTTSNEYSNGINNFPSFGGATQKLDSTPSLPICASPSSISQANHRLQNPSLRPRMLSTQVSGLEEENSMDGFQETEPRMEKITTQGSVATAKTCASTVVPSAFDRSLTSTWAMVPASVRFANQCLERSYERRYTSSPTMSSMDAPSVVDTSSSITYCSDVSLASSSAVSYKSKASFSAESKEKYLINIKSNISPRVRDIRRNLRLMEIKSYREKCVRSVSKSRAHYQNLDTINDSNYGCEDSSICSELSLPDDSVTVTDRITSTAKTIAKAMTEAITINLIFFTLNILFLLYKSLPCFQITAIS